MPVVQTVTAPSVEPQANSGLPYSSDAGATPDAFGVNVGAAQEQLGKGIGAAGDMLAQHAEKLQADENVSRAEAIFLNGDARLSNLTNDYKSLQGQDRVAALPKFMDDAAAIRQELLQEAKGHSPDVARRFDQLFSRQLGYSIKDAGTSAATATRQYQSDQHSAVKASSLGHIASDPEDDGRFLLNVQTGLEATRASEDYKGAALEVRQQHDEAFVSAAWSTRLTSMAKNDPLRARDLLEKNKNSLDGLTQIKLKDTIDQSIINVQSRVESDKIIQDGALVSDELKANIRKFEGYSKKPYADYKQTSSGYGTKAQPGDENIPPEQRKAVYEQRLERELGRAANIVDTFSPGLPKGTRDALISLTYNTGSDWTSAGLGQKIRAGDFEGAKANFTQYNQAGGEVNPALVARRGTEVNWFGGEATDTTDTGSRLTNALDKAREVALKTFPDDPGNQAKYMDMLQSRIKTDSTVLAAAARDNQLQIKNVVQSELVTPRQAGERAPTSYDQLSPKAQQAYDMAPPALQQSFQVQMRKNALQDVPETPERTKLLSDLRGESLNEPDKFMARTVADLDLTQKQKAQVSTWQQSRKALIERGTKIAGAMATMQPLLNDLQIGKSASDQTKNADYNKFSGVFEKAITDFMEEKKRPPNDKETREIGAGLLKDIVTSPGYIFGENHDRAYRVIADKTPITLNAANPQAHFATLPKGATFIGPDKTPRVKQ